MEFKTKINAPEVREQGVRVYSPNNPPPASDSSWLLQGGTRIPANADLNDYTTVGNYYMPSNYMNLKNCPTQRAFLLKVSASSGDGSEISQEVVVYDSLQHYARDMREGVWHKITVSPNEFVERNGGDWEAKYHNNKLFVLPNVPFTEIEPSHDTETYFRELLKWLCRNYPNIQSACWVGVCNPNLDASCRVHIYDTSIVNNEGLPEYADGIANNLNGDLILFGCNSYNYFFQYK